MDFMKIYKRMDFMKIYKRMDYKEWYRKNGEICWNNVLENICKNGDLQWNNKDGIIIKKLSLGKITTPLIIGHKLWTIKWVSFYGCKRNGDY